MSEKNTWPCSGKPEELKGQPIGMYHCEYCGEMQIAGVAHLPPQFPSQWEEPFPKIEEPKGPFDNDLFTPERLVGVLRRLIEDNRLREQHGEDTIGVLMKCGAFHEASDESFVAALAQAIEAT